MHLCSDNEHIKCIVYILLTNRKRALNKTSMTFLAASTCTVE